MRTKGWAEALGKNDGWESRPHRGLFWACGVCLALYLAYATFLAQSPVLTGTWETISSLLWFLACGAAIFIILMWACRRWRGAGKAANPVKDKFSFRFFLQSLGLSLLILVFGFLGCYPGGVSYDVYNQWTQAQTGLFNGWHPVFHTLLIGLGMRLTGGSYPLVLLLQILTFSLALSWLMEALRGWGVPKALLLAAQGLVVLTPVVGNSLMYLWKDDAMSIGAVLLCAGCVNGYFTRGAWFEKPRNAVITGLLLAYTTLVRHNAMFYTLPLMACLLLCYRAQWKKLLLTAGVMALGVGLVMGPLYGALDIIQPENTLEESVGIPMAILFDARLDQPDALDEETGAFLARLVTDEVFAAKYKRGNYNSIKFEYPREYISYTPRSKLLRMTLSTIANDPRVAFESFNAVTDLVWDVTGKNEGVERVRNSGDLQEVVPGQGRLNRLGAALQTLLEVSMSWLPLRYITQNIGVQMALLLLSALWALYRGGCRALTLCVPILLYNLGTMLLLCGNDARFFQFSMVISIPTMLTFGLNPNPGEKGVRING